MNEDTDYADVFSLEIERLVEQIKQHSRVGAAHEKREEYSFAIEAYKEAIQLSAELELKCVKNNNEKIAEQAYRFALMNHEFIGNIFEKLNNFPEAIEAFKKNKSICEMHNDLATKKAYGEKIAVLEKKEAERIKNLSANEIKYYGNVERRFLNLERRILHKTGR